MIQNAQYTRTRQCCPWGIGMTQYVQRIISVLYDPLKDGTERWS